MFIVKRQRSFQLASHSDYKVLNANEDSALFLNSKFITCFIDGSALGQKPNSIAYLLGGSEHMYWFEPWRILSALDMSFVNKQPSRMQG